MISTVSLAELPTGSVGIAVLVNGTRYYIPAVPVAEFD
jgi:hydroxymethylglutaryl-CoA reductase